ncbi:hypothetical protein [Halalkalicoccus jeotgali]|uniref:Uncharacterized protein n=1 Tax=Halalkalicoccus jeotgali (strain DSM 18796 / CECT 7217 / JCM 14584 / KCTC 4019 / B3) TaxID=795797 RepID=D8J623_HALJB|nr:hypothetical protein [Halalkalicoccus jeotgali]ADJ13829.1 hypothetical protein HacjB3_02180 [Halalkalicoccus jeotgali B3]ELY34125.1 hypothetical protein C497_17137 [Halalkalicoccus jeotgali B3]
MSTTSNGPTSYTHSREFTYDGYRIRLRINDDRMSYTAVASRDGEVVSRLFDLGPEAAGWSHSTLASLIVE